jgi:hypothetical protein
MADESVTLEFLARQNDRVLNEMASFRGDTTILTAIAMRVDASVSSLTVEVRALRSKLDGIDNRVNKLEDQSVR